MNENHPHRFAVKRRHFWRERSWPQVAQDWLTILLVGYLAVVLGLFFFQRNLLYFPDKTPFKPAEWGINSFMPITAETEDGLFTTSWFSAPADKTKPIVLFFQGNAGHPGYRNFKVRPWVEEGYGVLLVGYRGYAGNGGSPSEQGLYHDARAILNFLLKNGYPNQRWVIYGESLGTGVAVEMASEFPVAGLILEAPYTSVPAIGGARYPFLPIEWLSQDRFDSLSKIRRNRAPLLLIHGDRDVVIPIRFGKQLFDAANEPKQAAFIAGAGHNDLYDARTQQMILRFIEGLALQP